MYTRAGCHLCDTVWERLQNCQNRYRLHLEKIDVDLDPDLQTRYGDQVPVVAVNGRARFWGGVNPLLLERLLHAEAASCSSKPRQR
jgi:hypothetical protein